MGGRWASPGAKNIPKNETREETTLRLLLPSNILSDIQVITTTSI